jgi:hypothetical protein
MSAAALEQLAEAQAAMTAALLAHDLDTLEQAGDALAEAVATLRSVETWRGQDAARGDVSRAFDAAGATRGLVNRLADLNRRKLDRLVTLAGQPRAQAYTRNGTLA